MIGLAWLARAPGRIASPAAPGKSLAHRHPIRVRLVKRMFHQRAVGLLVVFDMLVDALFELGREASPPFRSRVLPSRPHLGLNSTNPFATPGQFQAPAASRRQHIKKQLMRYCYADNS